MNGVAPIVAERKVNQKTLVLLCKVECASPGGAVKVRERVAARSLSLGWAASELAETYNTHSYCEEQT